MTLYQILVVQPKNYVKIFFGHIEMLSKKNWFKKRFLMVNSSVLKKNWLGLTQEDYRSPPPRPENNRIKLCLVVVRILR